MINRRNLLLGGLGIVGVGGLGVWAFGRKAIEAELGSIVRRRLNYLRLDDGGVQAFAADQAEKFISKRVSMNRLKYHYASNFATGYRRFLRSTDTRSRIARSEDIVVSTYLLSSDFFVNGCDESRTIQYLGYYDPVRACGNPFARPVVVGMAEST
jgi:hypothetical protein